MTRRMTALCKCFPVSKVPSWRSASKRELRKAAKSEFRISKSETHSKFEARTTKTPLHFGFGAFGFVSGFEFRISRFGFRICLPCGLCRSGQTVPREIAGFALGVVEGELDGGEALIELFGFAGADDGRRDARLIEHPAHRDLHQAFAARFEEIHEMPHGLELGVLPVTLAVEIAGGAEREARAGRRRGALLVTAAQKTARQRVVGDDAQTLIAAERQQLALDLAVEQVVARLHAVEAGPTVTGTVANRERDLPRWIVRTAEVADRAGANQILEGTQGFLERCIGIRAVRLVEIDVVGAQFSQAVLDRLAALPPRQAFVVRFL